MVMDAPKTRSPQEGEAFIDVGDGSGEGYRGMQSVFGVSNLPKKEFVPR